jgi:hypothetical protein
MDLQRSASVLMNKTRTGVANGLVRKGGRRTSSCCITPLHDTVTAASLGRRAAGGDRMAVSQLNSALAGCGEADMRGEYLSEVASS